MTQTPDQAIDLRRRDLLLNGLTVASGAVDAISFLALGKIFTAFMTGNIVFLGLRVAGVAAAPVAVGLLASLAGFAAGVYLSTRIVTPDKSSGSWPHRVTVALAVSLIAHAVFLAVWFASNGQPSATGIYVLLASWGIAMGMQSAAVRRLHVEGVFTTAATATFLYIVSDITNWSATAVERRRLAGIVVSLLIGATAGGFLLTHARLYAPLLPFVVTLAVVTTAALVARAREATRPTQLRTDRDPALIRRGGST